MRYVVVQNLINIKQIYFFIWKEMRLLFKMNMDVKIWIFVQELLNNIQQKD